MAVDEVPQSRRVKLSLRGQSRIERIDHEGQASLLAKIEWSKGREVVIRMARVEGSNDIRKGAPSGWLTQIAKWRFRQIERLGRRRRLG